MRPGAPPPVRQLLLSLPGCCCCFHLANVNAAVSGWLVASGVVCCGFDAYEPLHSELLLLTTGHWPGETTRSCRPTCQPLCRLAAPHSGVEFFQICSPLLTQTGRAAAKPEELLGRFLTHGGAAPCWSADPGRGPLGRPLSGSCVAGWPWVYDRNGTKEWGSGSFIQKKKNCLLSRPSGKNGVPFPTLAQARRLDSYQGVCPIMPEQGDCRLRCAGYLNYPSRIPPGPIRRRPVPGPAGTGGALPPFPSLVSPTLCLPTAPSTQ